MQSDPAQTGLWVEMLDRYIYYFEVNCDEAGAFLSIQELATAVQELSTHEVLLREIGLKFEAENTSLGKNTFRFQAVMIAHR